MTEQRKKMFFSLSGIFAIAIVFLLVVAIVLFIQQYTRVDIPDGLASRLGKMVESQIKATHRIGLLNYLAMQNVIDDNKAYWKAQKTYVTLSAYYNGCLAGIIAQVRFRNKITQTQMDCLPKKNISETNISQSEQTFFETADTLAEPTDNIPAFESVAQNDTDGDSNKQSPLSQWYNFFDKVSSDRLEQEIKLLKIRSQSQSDIVNLLESFKWPDIGVIRPQPLIIGTGNSRSNAEQQQKKENTSSIDMSSFDCKTLKLTMFTDAEEDSENYIKDKNIRRLLHYLRDRGVCE
jgi:hypothetical protein